MIQVENACISFSGAPVLEEVSFTINPQERCALVGRNGSGKTTLFRLLVGQELPDNGKVTFSKGYRLGYLDQHIRFSLQTILEEAALGLKEEEREYLYKAEQILGVRLSRRRYAKKSRANVWWISIALASCQGFTFGTRLSPIG